MPPKKLTNGHLLKAANFLKIKLPPVKNEVAVIACFQNVPALEGIKSIELSQIPGMPHYSKSSFVSKLGVTEAGQIVLFNTREELFHEVEAHALVGILKHFGVKHVNIALPAGMLHPGGASSTLVELLDYCDRGYTGAVSS